MRRYTAEGGPEVEARIQAILDEAVAEVRRIVPGPSLRAFVLLGGYGRAEGGVEVRGTQELPHNNLDLLLIARGRGDPAALKARLDEALAPIGARHQIGLDLGVISEKTLARARVRVMWYDLRFGHRTLLGDAEFVKSLTRFRVDRILPEDMRDLLVNRGTLLVINRALMDLAHREPDTRRTLIRHAMKAIIGYGDAWLFFHRDYHWSYRERRERMRARRDAPERLRALYDEAMGFRFRADYAAWSARDLDGWLDEVVADLAPVHLEVESLRLARPGLTWDEHPRASLFAALRSFPLEPWAWLQKARSAVRALSDWAFVVSPPGPGRSRLDVGVRAAWAFAPARERLAVLFPLVAYRVRAPVAAALARTALRVDPDDPRELGRAFLAYWGRFGDPNFFAAARRMGLDIAEPPRRSG